MFGQGQYTAGAAVAGYISNPAATELGNVHMVLVLKAKMQDWVGGSQGATEPGSMEQVHGLCGEALRRLCMRL